MATLLDQLSADLVTARKAQDKPRTLLLSTILADVKNRRIELQRDPSDDDVIDVDHPGGGAHKAEFDAWRWVPFAELPGLIVPFKRPVYEGVVAAFTPLSSWSAGA